MRHRLDRSHAQDGRLHEIGAAGFARDRRRILLPDLGKFGIGAFDQRRYPGEPLGEIEFAEVEFQSCSAIGVK